MSQIVAILIIIWTPGSFEAVPMTSVKTCINLAKEIHESKTAFNAICFVPGKES